MTLLLANNPRERYQIGDTIPGLLNNGIMDKAAAMVPQIEKMMPKLDSILTSINTLLSDPALSSTLHNVEQLTASMAIAGHNLEKITGNDIPQLTHRLDTICGDFTRISGNLSKIDYASTMRQIDMTLANVKQLTDKLNQKDNSLGLLLNDPALYDNLSTTAANAASLLEDLKAHPKRYVHFSLFGRKEK